MNRLGTSNPHPPPFPKLFCCHSSNTSLLQAGPSRRDTIHMGDHFMTQWLLRNLLFLVPAQQCIGKETAEIFRNEAQKHLRQCENEYIKCSDGFALQLTGLMSHLARGIGIQAQPPHFFIKNLTQTLFRSSAKLQSWSKSFLMLSLIV